MMKKTAVVITLMYVALLMYWMLFGFNRTPSTDYQYNIIPFTTIIAMLTNQQLEIRYVLINIVGNIAVFVPFGVLLPLVCRKYTFGLFTIGVVTLELLQLTLRRGSLDVDDYLLNSLGYGIGLVLLRYMQAIVNKDQNG